MKPVQSRLLWLVATVALGLAPADAVAQVFTPSFLSPVRGQDLGLYLSGGFGPSGGLAVEAAQSRGMGVFDLVLRAGIGDGDSGAVVLLGAGYRNPLDVDLELHPDVELMAAVTGGAQAVLGSGSGFGVDAGVTVGSRVESGELRFTPYLNPRLALVETLRSTDGLDLTLLADLGVDLEISPRLVGRLALGLGGPTANFSLGVAWR